MYRTECTQSAQITLGEYSKLAITGKGNAWVIDLVGLQTECLSNIAVISHKLNFEAVQVDADSDHIRAAPPDLGTARKVLETPPFIVRIDRHIIIRIAAQLIAVHCALQQRRGVRATPLCS